MYLIDSNIYIEAFTSADAGRGLQAFHRVHLSRLVLSAVVASELLVGATAAGAERRLRLGLVEPFRARRRLHVPGWATWERATTIDRKLRRRPGFNASLRQRSFFHDILIAATAREIGATIITRNLADFEIIGGAVDLTCVLPWPE